MKISNIMKTIKISTIVLLVSLLIPAFTQNTTLPEVNLKNLDGMTVLASDIKSPGQITVIVFWKSNVKECCNQLCAINELYNESLKDKGVKVAAICMDGTGGFQHVKPFVYGHNFSFEIYIDTNGDFKRSMNVPSVPYTIIYDKVGKPFCKWAGYCEGIEHLMKNEIENYLAISAD